MKKTLVIAGIILILASVPVAALDYGINFNGGIKTSFVNPYVYEDVSFRMEFNDTFGAEIGLDVMENFQFSPYFYFCPMIGLYAGDFYINGGVMFFTTMTSPSEILFFGELGWRFADWQIGPGIGSIDTGISISPTIVMTNTGDGLGDAIGSSLLTIFNILKIKVGFSWYLPLK